MVHFYDLIKLAAKKKNNISKLEDYQVRLNSRS